MRYRRITWRRVCRNGDYDSRFDARGSSWAGVSHSCNLTQDGAWHQYVFNFTGADKATDTGVLIFSIAAQSGAATGAKIYVDNAYLGSAASPTVAGWRNEVFTTLQTLNPGTLRYMNGQELSSNDTYFEGADYVRGAAADNPAGNFPWTFSLTDMYAMAGALALVRGLAFLTCSVTPTSIHSLPICAGPLLRTVSVMPLSSKATRIGPAARIPLAEAEPVQYGQVANRNFGLDQGLHDEQLLDLRRQCLFHSRVVRREIRACCQSQRPESHQQSALWGRHSLLCSGGTRTAYRPDNGTIRGVGLFQLTYAVRYERWSGDSRKLCRTISMAESVAAR